MTMKWWDDECKNEKISEFLLAFHMYFATFPVFFSVIIIMSYPHVCMRYSRVHVEVNACHTMGVMITTFCLIINMIAIFSRYACASSVFTVGSNHYNPTRNCNCV